VPIQRARVFAAKEVQQFDGCKFLRQGAGTMSGLFLLQRELGPPPTDAFAWSDFRACRMRKDFCAGRLGEFTPRRLIDCIAIIDYNTSLL
jgi:hypothetical protein